VRVSLFAVAALAVAGASSAQAESLERKDGALERRTAISGLIQSDRKFPAAGQDLSTCKARGLAWSVGKPVKALKRLRTRQVRYVCTSCAATMDYNAARLTVVYDRSTGRVMKLSCN
jgi:hypothetical protein